LSTSFERLVGQTNSTQTNLLNEILKEYLYWTQFIINYESPFLTFDTGTMVALIEAVDDERLRKIVHEISNEAAVDFIKFRWKKVNFRNIVRYLESLSDYANTGSISIGPLISGNDVSPVAKDSQESEGDYQKYEIAVRHHLGRRWSMFMGMYISKLFESSIPNTKTSYEISTKSCFVYVTLPANA
jgi:hypothetical protein